MGTSRDRQGILRQAVVTLVVAVAGLMVATPASATSLRNTPTDCPVAELRGDAIDFAEPPPRELPEVLRSLDYDCAFDADGIADEVAGLFRTRVLVIQDPTFDEVMRAIRSIAASPSWVLERTTVMPGEDADVDLDGVLGREDLSEDIVAIFDRSLGEGRTSQRIDLRYIASASTDLGSATWSGAGTDGEGLVLDPSRGNYLSVAFDSVGDNSDATLDPEFSPVPWIVAFLLSAVVAVGGGFFGARSRVED